jgi:hypothetical protein
VASVKVKVDADGSGFHNVMTKVEGRVHKLGHQLGHGLKDNLVAFFGAATVGVAIENMVHFAHEIEQASNRIGIATDKVQEFRTIARHAGKDLGFFETVFRNIEKSAALAIGGDSKKAGIFKKLGISDDELKHLNKADLLSKMMKGTAGMDRTVAEQLLGGVAGPKNGGGLMAVRNEIANPDSLNITKVSPEDIAALAEAKRNWDDMAESMRAKLIPALVSVAESILNFCTNLKQGFQVVFAYVEALLNNIKNFSFKGGVKGLIEGNESATVGSLKQAWNFVTGKQGVKETFNNVWDEFANGGKKVVTGFFGEDAVKAAEDAAATMGQVTLDEDKANAEADAKRKADLAEEEKAKAGPVNREAAPAKAAKEGKELLDKTLKGSNEFLKIGGFMGVDATYRLERLSQETNGLLRQIVKNTTPPEDNGQTLDDYLGFE